MSTRFRRQAQISELKCAIDFHLTNNSDCQLTSKWLSLFHSFSCSNCHAFAVANTRQNFIKSEINRNLLIRFGLVYLSVLFLIGNCALRLCHITPRADTHYDILTPPSAKECRWFDVSLVRDWWLETWTCLQNVDKMEETSIMADGRFLLILPSIFFLLFSRQKKRVK